MATTPSPLGLDAGSFPCTLPAETVPLSVLLGRMDQAIATLRLMAFLDEDGPDLEPGALLCPVRELEGIFMGLCSALGVEPD